MHVKDLGMSPHWVTVSLLAGIGVETWFMFKSSQWIPKVAATHALVFVLVVGCVRWILTSWTTTGWIMAAAQASHGVTFGFFYVLLVWVTREHVQPHARATGQTVMAAVVFGGGGVLGSLTAGAAYDLGKGPLAFGAAAGFELLALALLTLWRVSQGRATAVPHPKPAL